MRKLLNPELALGFLIATILWIGVLGWQASHAPTDSEKRQCEESAAKSGHKTEECKSIWEKTTTDPVAFFTFWLVIFTGALGVSTVMLWRAGEKQIKLSAETAAAQSRDMSESIEAAKRSADAAILSAQTSKAAIRGVIAIKNFRGFCQNPNGIVEGYGVLPNIENVGSTHTTCQILASSAVIDAGNDYIFERPAMPPPIGLISPGMKINPGATLGFSLADAVRIWKGEARFLYYCRIDYGDIFGDPHHIEQCVSVGLSGDPRNPPLNNDEFLTYSPYGTQNTAS
jgi:hypothetical protein